MAIQNAIHTPNKVTKKKYFYDPFLEKGILNTVTTLGRDSSMDNKDYKDICFCPSNNKLYAVRASEVDVICPTSTVETQSPEATVSVGGSSSAAVYCPTVDRIFVAGAEKVSIINPQSNKAENEITISPSAICAAYSPTTNRVYIGCSTAEIIVIDPGKVLNDNLLTGAKIEITLSTILSSEGYSQITKICVNPERNYLYFFDGLKNGFGGGHRAGSLQILMNKENQVSYSYANFPIPAEMNFRPWPQLTLTHEMRFRDVIYCPFDHAEYWLLEEGSIGRVFRIGEDYSKEIILPQQWINYKKLVYCPDNNMIYALGNKVGPSGMQMINPADSDTQVPVTPFFDDSLSVVNSGVCYSPFMNRIYGVGTDGYIEYIDPTT